MIEAPSWESAVTFNMTCEGLMQQLERFRPICRPAVGVAHTFVTRMAANDEGEGTIGPRVAPVQMHPRAGQSTMKTALGQLPPLPPWAPRYDTVWEQAFDSLSAYTPPIGT